MLIGEKERLGTRGASKPTRENDDGKRIGQSFVGVAGRKAMSHDFAVGADTQNSIRETSVPLWYEPATWGKKTCKGRMIS